MSTRDSARNKVARREAASSVVLSPQDAYLFNEGTNNRLFERLARHEKEAYPVVAGADDDFIAAVEKHERAVADEIECSVISPADNLGRNWLWI